MTEAEKKARVNALLKQNARNVANYGTKGQFDLKTQEAFDSAWEEIENEIKGLNLPLWQTLKAGDD